MNPFDLLFIALFLTAVLTLIAAGWFALRRQFGCARKVLFRLLVGSAVYMGVVIVVSLFLPRRVLRVGDTLCFDDWCVAVTRVRQASEGDRMTYRVDLRLSGRARRVAQRERNLAVYLADDHGRRYDPVASSSDVPFSVLLRPQEAVDASRAFTVPANARRVGVTIAHEGGFPIGWFIIGYDTWFRKAPIVWVE